jgi:hypothetical protein
MSKVSKSSFYTAQDRAYGGFYGELHPSSHAACFSRSHEVETRPALAPATQPRT